MEGNKEKARNSLAYESKKKGRGGERLSDLSSAGHGAGKKKRHLGQVSSKEKWFPKKEVIEGQARGKPPGRRLTAEGVTQGGRGGGKALLTENGALLRKKGGAHPTIGEGERILQPLKKTYSCIPGRTMVCINRGGKPV